MLAVTRAADWRAGFVPVSIVGVVVVTGVFYLLVVCAEAFALGRRGIAGFIGQASPLANLLPFISLGWLLIGAIAAGILRARRPATFQALGRAVAPNLDKQLEPD